MYNNIGFATSPHPCLVLWVEQVRGGSVGLNHPDHFPMIVISSGTHWFEKVWKRWTTPNSLKITLWWSWTTELPDGAVFIG